MSYSACVLIGKCFDILVLQLCLMSFFTFGFIIQYHIYVLDCFDTVREISILLNQHLNSSSSAR